MLRWRDVDLERNRIRKRGRLYRGSVDVPKTGAKTIPLPPPAKAVLEELGLPGDGEDWLRETTVFKSKTGKRLSAPTLSMYWAVVRAKAGLDKSYDFYRCTKHLGVHRLYLLGFSERAIAAQAGWAESAVGALLDTYGHKDQVALAECDAMYAQLEAEAAAAQPTHVRGESALESGFEPV